MCLKSFSFLLAEKNSSSYIRRRAAPERDGSFFDNPKTNLTYEKTSISYFKYRAKSDSNICHEFDGKKYLSLIN
jgi:hypothetical protein